jgi:uncharacterized membrane protein
MASEISLPQDFQTNFLMFLRWIHFVAGIIFLGLGYFFTFVGFSFAKNTDPATRGKVLPGLFLPALHWLRWASVMTVLAGVAYWGNIVASDARNAGEAPTRALVSFLVIWTATWGLMYALLIPGKGILNNGWFLAILYVLIIANSAHLFLHLNTHGWESNRLLAIGVGGGIGWIMMFNVWGILWRIQKRLIAWTKANAENGTPMPEQSARMARMAFLAARTNLYLSFPLLFFMGAASHYPMFGG